MTDVRIDKVMLDDVSKAEDKAVRMKKAYDKQIKDIEKKAGIKNSDLKKYITVDDILIAFSQAAAIRRIYDKQHIK